MSLYYINKPELDKLAECGAYNGLLDALRLNTLYMIQQAGSGHPGGSLSSLTIMVPLFFGVMGADDVFITSKGHDAPALYACLQAKGIIPFDTIHTLRRPGGLPGHPTIDVPGVLFNTGSLGMGISKANGLAAADRLAGRKRKIHVLVGDGEFQEGQIWESLQVLYQNVTVHIDHNHFGLSGGLKLAAGARLPHGIELHNTVKGRGVSFMEGNNKYHAGALSNEEYETAAAEITTRLNNAGVFFKVAEKVPYPRAFKPNCLLADYSRIIADIGTNPKVVVMDADLSPDCGLSAFAEKYPDRFSQCGIAEQDMVSMATGLSAGGFIPMVHSFAAFLCRRANEQIYNACTERRHIVFVGHFAGKLPVGPGESHECMEDTALMRTMPGMTILAPFSAEDLEGAVKWAVNEATGPVYISIPAWGLEGIRG